MAIQIDRFIFEEQKLIKVTLTGVLENDEKKLSELHIPDGYEIQLVLNNLTGITSLGVRSFENWIRSIKLLKLTILYAPKCFIDQANMISGFLPENTFFKSFSVPYYSERTDEETNVIFSVGVNFYKIDNTWKFSFPEVLDSSNEPMVIDVQTDRYFKFLSIYK